MPIFMEKLCFVCYRPNNRINTASYHTNKDILDIECPVSCLELKYLNQDCDETGINKTQSKRRRKAYFLMDQHQAKDKRQAEESNKMHVVA